MTSTQPTAASSADSSPANGLGDRVVRDFRTMTSSLRKLLDDIGEIERRGAFRSGGYTSAASWVMAHLSVGYPTARGYVDVGSALVGLPELADALGSGEVSFDQARCLARIATPASDAELARQARRWSAAQTEDFVRCEETRRADDERRRRQEALTTLRAEEAKRREADRGAAGGPVAGTAPGSGVGPGLGSEPGTDLTASGSLFAPKASPARCTAPPGTPRPGSLRLHVRRDGGTLEGWFPTEEFAALESALLAIARSEPADAVTRRQAPLPERMAHALLERVGSTKEGERAVPTLVVHADASLLDATGDGRAVAAVPGAGPLSAEVLRRLACDAKVRLAIDEGGLTLDLGHATRLPSAALAREVLRRDEGCRFPGCGVRRFLQIHHVVPWTVGGATDLDNLAAHCVRDHRRIHHEGWEVSGDANVELRYRSPDGRVLVSVPSPMWGEGGPPGRNGPQRR